MACSAYDARRVCDVEVRVVYASMGQGICGVLYDAGIVCYGSGPSIAQHSALHTDSLSAGLSLCGDESSGTLEEAPATLLYV